ncbi:hypothetical protein ETI11_01295 [Macrococcoides canis]|uniref:hypothetical protein n=1 Tax=Macrococcoides canis TaxID=1855823 RepID=UPI00105DDB8A|nr:hypothetical protein [Macrococcus canis]TDM38055.1 hypothetical protein ETI11_01295 [Macrococcus canis]
MRRINSFLKPLSEEEIAKKERDSYEKAKTNLERMSYWLPLVSAKNFLSIPQTQIIQFNFEMFKELLSDKNHEKTIEKLQLLFEQEVELSGELFMKTGNFSDKFHFSTPHLKDRANAGKQFYSMWYTSLMFGVPLTTEWVLREFISNKEELDDIYDGMPLRTEYRVFFDFDTKEVIGISNYWHPNVMKNGIRDEGDLSTYKNNEERIIEEFNAYKHYVIELVVKQVENCGLKGKWSIDVMKNGDEFYLIDMARMEFSALINEMEEMK